MDTAVVPSSVVVNHCALQLWASSVGLGGEVERLIAARRELSTVLTEAQGREIHNNALVLHLREAWQKASRAADLLSTLEYYRNEGEMEHDDDKLLHDIADQNMLFSTPGSDIKFSNNDIAEAAEDTTESSSIRNEDSSQPALQIIPYNASTMVVANTTSPVPHLEILDKNISREISEHVEECNRITMYVRKALELENLDNHIVQKYHSTRSDPRETSPCHTEPKVHGRDQERDFIISKLTGEESTRKSLSVLAITGHGGVGKTTLAKLVFNNSIVSKHFDILLWVYVSVHFDQVKIMRELLDTLCRDKHENIKKSMVQLQEKLEYMLKSKRVLLVMDDMWEDSKKEEWDELLNPLLTNDVNGNRVLVTTRKPSVATMIGASDLINLDGLNKDDFWCLFKECAFGDENYKGERRLEKIGKQIVEKLKGNPLAVKTLGKVLRRRFDVDYWRRVLDTSEWKYESDENDIMPALTISYKSLPVHLQQCFSYCAVFPKYYRYDKEHVVNMWIAQDFIYSPDMHRRLEDIGIEYFNDLVDAGFLETQSELSTLLIMHDLIHDLAQKVSSHESFTIEDNEPRDAPLLVRHVSVITEREYKTEINGTVHPNELFLREFSSSFRTLQRRSLSTLMLFGPHDSGFADTFRQELNEVRSVRVLKLEMVFFELDALIGNISAFINLRYLELGCFYEGPRLELPEAICRLYHLQVLDIKKNWGVNTVLPRGMSKLVNLRHFIAEKELHAKIAGIGKMVALQELKAFDVREASEFSISQLNGLNQLRGSISISSLYSVRRREEATEARLCDKVYITSLELSWYNLSGSLILPRTLPILEELLPPSGLINLRIVHYRHALPSWLSSNVHLTSLRSIHLVNCLHWETIPHPQQLPLLQEMHLINLSRVKKIEIGPLKILELRRLQNLRQCILFDKEQSYANLQILEVEGCPRLNEFLSQIFISSSTYQFHGLRRLQIHNDFILSTIPLLQLIVIDSLADIDLCGENTNFGGFRLKPFGVSNGFSLQIEGNQNIQKLDERLFTLDKLKDLRELEIRDYSIVTHQHRSWEGFQQLTSLKKFRMINCPAIFPTNLELFLPPSIEELEFRRCNITGIQLSQLLLNLRSLRSFKLDYCGGVASLPVGLFTDEQNQTAEGSWRIPPNCLRSMQSLQISFTRGKEDASSMMLFSSKRGLGNFVSLEKIVIENCLTLLSRMVSGGASHISPSSLVKLHLTGVQYSILHFSQVSSTVDLDVSGCPSLTCLNLDSCTALEKLSVSDCLLLRSLEGLQSCMALRDLSVRNCDLLHSLRASLSSLKTLAIEANKSLASLELHSCTALQKLCIEGCPGLASWEGLKFLSSLDYLRVKSSPGFTRSWVSAAAEVKSEHNFSLPLQELYTDDIGVLCVPICSQLTSLKTLFIDGGRGARHGHVDILSDNHVKGLLLLTSLRHLALEGFEHLQSLPAELKSLTSLKRLNIGNCGRITSLPVGGLPDSLKDLEIFHCSKELNAVCRGMLQVRKINLSIDGTDEE
ncbi:disease resistance protein RGA2-like [Phragmites australis]|uniref:disease resistance protein RGA2-like n=1 Tax=Phragmites australis TaxID=29695 RepID=UPI002D77EF6C|nr:disease resistance protein RGA2-like [Phragmites australis]